MNAITRKPSPAAASATEIENLPEDAAAQNLEHTLRRTGRKPVRFTGAQIIQALGAEIADGMWYDLNIFRTAANAIIVHLAARRGNLGHTDVLRVEICATLDEAAAWLTAHKCAEDVPVPEILAEASVPLASAMIQAVQLRQRLARVEEEFSALLSDVFEALGLADSEADLAPATEIHAPA